MSRGYESFERSNCLPEDWIFISWLLQYSLTFIKHIFFSLSNTAEILGCSSATLILLSANKYIAHFLPSWAEGIHGIVFFSPTVSRCNSIRKQLSKLRWNYIQLLLYLEQLLFTLRIQLLYKQSNHSIPRFFFLFGRQTKLRRYMRSLTNFRSRIVSKIFSSLPNFRT